VLNPKEENTVFDPDEEASSLDPEASMLTPVEAVEPDSNSSTLEEAECSGWLEFSY